MWVSELLAGKALVGHDGVALEIDAGEHLGRDLALAAVGRGELEGDRHPVGCAQQIEPKAPEVAGMRGAVPVGGVAGELRAPGRLARLATRHRGRVKQSQAVAERRRVKRQVGDDLADRGRQRTQALVVAGLLGQVGKQVPQPPAREREELAVVGDLQEHLRDCQRDELGVGDPGRAPWPSADRQEIVDAHIKCGDEGVKVGEHEASLVDVAIATPSFGALVMSPRATPRDNLESTI